MELLLIAAVIALLRWVADKMSSEEEAPPAPLPPPVPAPRPRRFRRPAPPAVPSPAEVLAARPPAPPARAAAVAAPRPAPRPASPYAREFRDVAALRRAVVAREVLGPPVSLRR